MSRAIDNLPTSGWMQVSREDSRGRKSVFPVKSEQRRVRIKLRGESTSSKLLMKAKNCGGGGSRNAIPY